VKAARRPYAVYQGGDSWKWACHVVFCHAGDWSTSHQAAIKDGQDHLREHQRFGFTEGRRDA
jgi:hypothetical protein